MTDRYIKYRSGYKYQLDSSYRIKTNIEPPSYRERDFITLDVEGNLTVIEGYAWDGPSGWVIDTKENLRASLVHDALYQLMRKGDLPVDPNRDKADRLFKEMCNKDGVPLFVAYFYYLCLKYLAKQHAEPAKVREVHNAPLKGGRRSLLSSVLQFIGIYMVVVLILLGLTMLYGDFAPKTITGWVLLFLLVPILAFSGKWLHDIVFAHRCGDKPDPPDSVLSAARISFMILMIVFTATMTAVVWLVVRKLIEPIFQSIF